MKRAAFIAALCVQLGILALVPAKKIKAYYTGREIKLATEQYDPYDVMKGYYANLTYEISRPPDEERVPRSQRHGRSVYMILETDEAGIARPVRTVSRLGEIPGGADFIRGIRRGWRIEYGLERFYMPEERRHEVNSALSEARGETDAVLGIARLDSDGEAVLTAIEIRGRRFDF
jgi:uncharacterized membrane-anchored protein